MPRILLTRPEDRSKALADDLARDGWDAMIWPLLTIRPLLQAPPVIESDEVVVFTSARGVEMTPRLAPGLRAVCVGPATAKAAADRGFDAAHADGDAEALLQKLIASQTQRFVHIRGEDTRGALVDRLIAMGRSARDVIVYRAETATVVPNAVKSALIDRAIDAIALFSPRTAASFAQLIPTDWVGSDQNLRLICISEATAEPVRSWGRGEVIVAAKPNGAAMRAAICGAAITE